MVSSPGRRGILRGGTKEMARTPFGKRSSESISTGTSPVFRTVICRTSQSRTRTLSKESTPPDGGETNAIAASSIMTIARSPRVELRS
jgi:hypothetical protein